MTRYEAIQNEGRPETDDLEKMWNVIDTTTDEVVASWRQTPIMGMTQKDAEELAKAWESE